VNIQLYHENRKRREAEQPKVRLRCHNCLQPDFSCYCHAVSKFDPNIDFIILIHPIEQRRRIATGRMSHLCLQNSQLIVGHDFSNNKQIREIVEDPKRHCVILYPGLQSKNITPLSNEERKSLFPKDKVLTIFVIDGTWSTARSMVRSRHLNTLQRICFSPERPSNFRVRKQPKPDCISTIEAIHHTIELIGESRGFATHTREHDQLLNVFDWMVERQIEFLKSSREKYGAAANRRVRKRPERGTEC
jgi:DTW domain-containing protein